MKAFTIIAVLALILFSGCNKEFELDQSIYVPDEVYPSLPAYSEWGYNTFGAFYERKLFVYSNNEVPAKFINRDGYTRFMMKGRLTSVQNFSSYGYSYSEARAMSLIFELPGFDPLTYEDLVVLNDSVINLQNQGIKVSMIIENDTTGLTINYGEIDFRKAQHLLVDRQPVSVILSGYFSFQARINDEPVSMSHGRFDISIDPDDFVKYNQ